MRLTKSHYTCQFLSSTWFSFHLVELICCLVLQALLGRGGHSRSPSPRPSVDFSIDPSPVARENAPWQTYALMFGENHWSSERSCSMMMDCSSLATKPGISGKASQQLPMRPMHFLILTGNTCMSVPFEALRKRMESKAMQLCISTRSVNVKPVLIQVYGSAGTVTSADNSVGIVLGNYGQLFGIRLKPKEKFLQKRMPLSGAPKSPMHSEALCSARREAQTLSMVMSHSA